MRARWNCQDLRFRTSPRLANFVQGQMRVESTDFTMLAPFDGDRGFF